MTQYIFFGIVTGLLFTEFTGVSPGGVIVPAYIAMYLHDPRRLLSTFILSLLSMAVVRLLSSYMILYGRRRFAVYMLTGIFIKTLLLSIYGNFGLSRGVALYAIGFLIPGIIARDMEKQGILVTVPAIAIVSCITRMICILI